MDGELPRYTDPEQEPITDSLRRRSTSVRASQDSRSTRQDLISRFEQSGRRHVSITSSSRHSNVASSSRDEGGNDSSEDDLASPSLHTSSLPLRPGARSHSSDLDSPETSDNSSTKHAMSERMSFDDNSRPSSPTEDPIDNSPYDQVRASVPATDDLTLSINTPRMWTLAMVFAILGSSTNLFFSLRFPSVTLTPVVALLLVHPLGIMWDRFLKRANDPEEIFENGYLERRLTPGVQLASDGVTKPTTPSRLRLWLATGRWNRKEHACVYIAANVSFGFAFATDVIVEQNQFYNQETPVFYQIALVLSTQILGYSLAGLCKTFLVKPSGMIWPSNLMATAMFSNLHQEESYLSKSISRWKFFVNVFLAAFAWYFLPGLLMPALSYFNIVTWFAPNSTVVASLFGVSSGLGMFPVTFDWSQVAYTGSPLVTPFWAAMNVLGGLVVVMWIIAPIMYFTNSLYSAFMPILSAVVFDNEGDLYDVSRILTPDFLLDETAYHEYSRVFLPITYVLSYAIQFASMTALISHTICWHGKDIWRQLHEVFTFTGSVSGAAYTVLPDAPNNDTTSAKSSTCSSSTRKRAKPPPSHIMDAEDVHNRLMKRYPEVPHFWYLTTGAITLGVGMFVVEYYPIFLPWWGLLLALTICVLLFIPIGIVNAVTNLQVSIYLISQIIAGTIFPGRGVANIIFVTYAYITSTQGLKFASDLKLGHYVKIPPRLLFSVQLVATIISSLSQIGVLNWMINNIPNICTAQAINGFTCPIARVHFNGSVLWGVIGPKRFFGPGAIYQPLLWAFPIGAIAPVVVWYIAERQRKKCKDDESTIWTKVNFPVIFGGLSWIPPATGLNFSVWALVCFIFNYVIKRRRPEWWRRYTMTLSAALDAGVAFGVLVVFFAVVYPGFSKGLVWFGTEIYKRGCDWQACPLKYLRDGEKFGPDHW